MKGKNEMFDLQKAPLMKRIAAYIFDCMMILIVFSLAAGVIAWATNISGYAQEFADVRNEYLENYGIDTSIAEEDLTDEQIALYREAEIAFQNDERAYRSFSMIFNLSLIIICAGLFIAFMVLEFIIPLFLRNGQTLGKKMFGIGVMHTSGVRIKNVALFVRGVLGKYTVETMIPVMAVLLIVFGRANLFILALLLALLVFQIAFVIRTNTNSALHDVFASTVTVDIGSQMIFEDDQALMDYKNRLAKEKADNSDYF